MSTAATANPKLPPQPVVYVVWRRANGSRPWVKAGRVATHAEAVAMIDGKGDWWIAPLSDARLAPVTTGPAARN